MSFFDLVVNNLSSCQANCLFDYKKYSILLDLKDRENAEMVPICFFMCYELKQSMVNENLDTFYKTLENKFFRNFAKDLQLFYGIPGLLCGNEVNKPPTEGLINIIKYYQDLLASSTAWVANIASFVSLPNLDHVAIKQLELDAARVALYIGCRQHNLLSKKKLPKTTDWHNELFLQLIKDLSLTVIYSSTKLLEKEKRYLDLSFILPFAPDWMRTEFSEMTIKSRNPPLDIFILHDGLQIEYRENPNSSEQKSPNPPEQKHKSKTEFTNLRDWYNNFASCKLDQADWVNLNLLQSLDQDILATVDLLIKAHPNFPDIFGELSHLSLNMFHLLFKFLAFGESPYDWFFTLEPVRLFLQMPVENESRDVEWPGNFAYTATKHKTNIVNIFREKHLNDIFLNACLDKLAKVHYDQVRNKNFDLGNFDYISFDQYLVAIVHYLIPT